MKRNIRNDQALLNLAKISQTRIKVGLQKLGPAFYDYCLQSELQFWVLALKK